MKRSFTVILVVCALLLLALELIRPTYSTDPTRDLMISTLISRSVGGALFLILIYKSKLRVFGISRDKKALLCILPALAVAINNAPVIGLVSGAAKINGGAADIVLFALQSLSVALFEEAAFRGYLFPLVLEKYRERSLFFSSVTASAVFAAFHLVNLFVGSSPAATFLQVGYSFLIGGMCAVVLLKTRCIWVCIALHAIYNFGGMLIPTLGYGRVWDSATVAITAVLGTAVLVTMLLILSRTTKEEAEALYKK